MKATTPLGLSLCLIGASVGESALSSTLQISLLGEIRQDCRIVQCMDPSRFFNECEAATNGSCAYNATLILNSNKTAEDNLCVVQGYPFTTPAPAVSPTAADDIYLWPKLDLSAGIVPAAELKTFKKNAGTMYLTTEVPAPKAVTFYVRASTTQDCDATLNESIAQKSAGSMKAGTQVVDLSANYPASYDVGILDGTYTALLNSTANVTNVGSFTGFYAENFTLSAAYDFTTPGNTYTYKMGGLTIQNAAGTCLDTATCVNETTLQGIYDCIEDSAEGCTLSASYSLLDTITPARSYCVNEDNTVHMFKNTLTFEGLDSSQVQGTIVLTVGGVPAETCSIQVRGVRSSSGTGSDCGLADAEGLVDIVTVQVGPTQKSMSFTSIPDNVGMFVLEADRDWMYCGGAVRTVATDRLAATVSYVKESDVADTSTTTAASDLTTVPADPFDLRASNGAGSAIALASAAGYVALLL